MAYPPLLGPNGQPLTDAELGIGFVDSAAGRRLHDGIATRVLSRRDGHPARHLVVYGTPLCGMTTITRAIIAGWLSGLFMLHEAVFLDIPDNASAKGALKALGDNLENDGILGGIESGRSITTQDLEKAIRDKAIDERVKFLFVSNLQRLVNVDGKGPVRVVAELLSLANQAGLTIIANSHNVGKKIFRKESANIGDYFMTLTMTEIADRDEMVGIGEAMTGIMPTHALPFGGRFDAAFVIDRMMSEKERRLAKVILTLQDAARIATRSGKELDVKHVEAAIDLWK